MSKKKVKISLDKENSNPNEVNKLRQKEEKPISTENISEEDESHIDVYSMKVVELRKELRSRGLDRSGLKKDLQKRLEEALQSKDGEIDADEHGEEQDNDINMPVVESGSESSSDDKEEEDSGVMEVESVGETNSSNCNDCNGSESEAGLEEEKEEEKEEEEEGILEEENREICDKEDEEVCSPSKLEVTASSELLCPIETIGEQDQDGRPPESNTSDSVSDVDEVMGDCSGGDTIRNNEQESTEFNDEKLEKTECSQAVEDVISSPKKNKFGSKLMKATTKLFSPKKKSPKKDSSPKKLKTAEIESGGSNVVTSDISNTALSSEVSTHDSKRSSMVCNMTEEEIRELKNEEEKRKIREALELATKESLSASSKTSQRSTITNESVREFDTPAVHVKAPSIQSNCSSLSSNSSSVSSSTKSIHAKKKALAEARKARLEKMRGKVRLK